MLRFGRLFRAPALLAVIAVAIAACGTGNSSAAPTTAALPSGVIGVETREYKFTPSTLTAPAGSVTFSVRNAGTEEHEFEIFKGETVVDEIEGMVPGLTKTLTVTLEAGDYTFVCKLNGHDQLGMTGTLTVN